MSRWELFVWFWAPGGVLVALTATVVSRLRGRRAGTGIGAAATVTAIVVMVSSWRASADSFTDLGMAAMFALVVAPLTLLALVLALFPARPGSWWRARRPSAQNNRSTADSTPRNSS